MGIAVSKRSQYTEIWQMALLTKNNDDICQASLHNISQRSQYHFADIQSFSNLEIGIYCGILLRKNEVWR